MVDLQNMSGKNTGLITGKTIGEGNDRWQFAANHLFFFVDFIEER
jgi:hypothetical protein